MRDLTRWIVFLAILVQASLLSGGEPDAKPGNELSAEEFMLANALWTLLHETAHAVIDELDILFLGSEEDAADQLATIALLRGDPDFDLSEKISAADAVIAAATAWRVEWELEQREERETTYWDSHSLSIQRFYNMMCLLYGSDPQKYAQIAGQLGLPFERAYVCADYENQRAIRSVGRIMERHARRQAGDAYQGKVVYEDTFTEGQERIAAAIRQAKIAERIASRIEKTLTLPHDITITFAHCANDPTAFWRHDRREIVMCYELLARFLYLHRARQCLQTDGLTQDELDECLSARHR